MLSPDQIEFYRVNGYLTVENVLQADQVQELRQLVNTFVERSSQVTQSDDLFDLEPGHTPEQPKLRRLKNPSDQDPLFDRIVRSDQVLDIVAQFIGPSIRTNGNKLNMKSAAFGSPVQWHQDWAFYPHTNDDLLAVGLAIDDMQIANGCLQVIPGSHRGRIYDHHVDGHFAGGISEDDFDDRGAVSLEVPAGGMSIHHARTLHGSLPNTSQQPRRLWLIQYCAGDAWPLVDVDWKAYGEGFVRGTPTAEPRVTPIPVRLPLPPAKHGGSIYENQSVLRRSTFSHAVSAGDRVRPT